MADEKKYIEVGHLIKTLRDLEIPVFAVSVLTECIIPHEAAADVRPVVRGRWQTVGIGAGERCSVCGAHFIGDSPMDWEFCPNCGADMREANDGN